MQVQFLKNPIFRSYLNYVYFFFNFFNSKRSRRFPKKSREQWSKIAKRQYNREKESKEQMQPEGEGSDAKLQTNQIQLAPPEIREQ